MVEKVVVMNCHVQQKVKVSVENLIHDLNPDMSSDFLLGIKGHILNAAA